MIAWKRERAGLYVGSLDGRKVARIRRNEGQKWAYAYRGPQMGAATAGEPTERLADAKAAVEAALGVPANPPGRLAADGCVPDKD